MRWLLNQPWPGQGIYGHGRRSYAMRIKFRFSPEEECSLSSECGTPRLPVTAQTCCFAFRVQGRRQSSQDMNRAYPMEPLRWSVPSRLGSVGITVDKATPATRALTPGRLQQIG